MNLGSITMRSNQNAKALGLPLLLTLAIGAMILYAGFYSFGRITKQFDDLKESQVEETILKSKSDALSDVQIGNLDASNRSLVAMPRENPGLFMVTQLKLLSEKYGLLVTDIGMEKESEFTNGLSRAKIVFVYETENVNSVISFFKEIQTLSPLSTIEKIDINGRSDIYEVESEIYVYWSDFPESIPPVSDPIVKLSTSDQEILTKLSTLTVPPFTVLNPADPVERTQPF